MSFFVVLPNAIASARAATLVALGFPGPHFTIAMRPAGGGGNTHMAMSCLFNDAAFQAAVQGLPGLQLSVAGTRVKGFDAFAAAQSLEVGT